MIGTITLNPSIDQLITVKRLVKDDANRATNVTHYPGGKGVNVSKVVRELGGATRAHVLLGGFVGGYWKRLVAGMDIAYTATALVGETRINSVLTDLKDQTQTRISAPGPQVPEKAVRIFLKRLLSSRPRPSFWALGGSLPVGLKPDTYAKLVRCLQATNGVPCILDTDDEALQKGVEARPFMIKPNEYEMQRLMGKKFTSTEDYIPAARKLVRRGIKIVIVSLGRKGALFVNDKEVFHAAGLRVSEKSKVGAGDSLIGGVALGLMRKMTLREAAKLGIAASASAVMREAPRLCRRQDIARLIQKVIITPF